MTGLRRVMLVEDHTLMREGIKSLLERVENVQVVLEAASGAEALAAVGQPPPDVVFMDISLPDVDGIEVSRRLLARWPSVRVIMLSMYTDSQYVHDAFTAGAAGYLTKSVTKAQLVDTIELVMQGQTVLPHTAAHLIYRSPPESAPLVPGRPPVDQPAAAVTLSERETEVMQLLAAGCHTEEIGRRLFISPKTVKTHLQRVFGKLRVSDRLQAVMEAVRLGILPAAGRSAADSPRESATERTTVRELLRK